MFFLCSKEPFHLDTGTDKPLFGVFKQFSFFLKKQLFFNEGVIKSNLILEKAIIF